MHEAMLVIFRTSDTVFLSGKPCQAFFVYVYSEWVKGSHQDIYTKIVFKSID
jgi:hypothetical protein